VVTHGSPTRPASGRPVRAGTSGVVMRGPARIRTAGPCAQGRVDETHGGRTAVAAGPCAQGRVVVRLIAARTEGRQARARRDEWAHAGERWAPRGGRPVRAGTSGAQGKPSPHASSAGPCAQGRVALVVAVRVGGVGRPVRAGTSGPGQRPGQR